MIRIGRPDDAPAIVEIYAPSVLTTATSFETAVPSVEEMTSRITNTLATHPWLVYTPSNEGVLGYVYASQHRTRAAYQWSVDVSVYIHERGQRRGLGRALYTSLFAILRLQGFFNAYAGAAQPNPGSVGLHAAMGFERIGVYEEVGYKFGRWHNVLWMGLEIQPKAADPAPPIPFAVARDLPDFAAALDAGTPLLRA